MGLAKKIFIGTGISALVGGIIWAALYLKGKSNTGDKLDTDTRAMIWDLNLKTLTLTIRIDITLKNPTEGTLTIKQPYVRVLYENKPVGTSQIVDKVFKIGKYGVKPLDAIYLSIPATGLLTLGDGLFKVLVKKQPAQIVVVALIPVLIAGQYIVQEKKSDPITLQPKK